MSELKLKSGRRPNLGFFLTTWIKIIVKFVTWSDKRKNEGKMEETRKIIRTIDVPVAEKLTLNKLAWQAYVETRVLFRCGNFIVLADYDKYIFLSEPDNTENPEFDVLMDFSSIRYCKTNEDFDKEKTRYVEYNCNTDEVKFKKDKLDNIMDRDPMDYIPIICMPSNVKECILSAIKEKESESTS